MISSNFKVNLPTLQTFFDLITCTQLIEVKEKNETRTERMFEWNKIS